MTLELAHVVLQTPHLEEMRDWYCSVLDAHVVFESDALCFITFDDEHHRLALKRLDEHTPRTALTVGIHHTGYSFDSLTALADRFTALKNIGIEPELPIQHGVTTSLYYGDPDGNAVELAVDNFASPETATKYMQGAEYAADPVGPLYDPQQLVAALAAGFPEGEIATRAWALAHPAEVFEQGGQA